MKSFKITMALFFASVLTASAQENPVKVIDVDAMTGTVTIDQTIGLTEAGQTLVNVWGREEYRKGIRSVYIMLGQSNMVGVGGEFDILPDNYKAFFPDTRVKYCANLNEFLAHERIYDWQDLDGVIAQPLYLAGPPFPPTDRKIFGPELSFAHQIMKEEQRVAIVKYAVGGTKIEQWTNTYLASSKTWIDNQLLQPGIKNNYVIKGIVWWQGESNDEEDKTEYEAELKALFASYRAHYGEAIPIVIVGSNFGSSPANIHVRRAQCHIAQDVQGVKFVDAFYHTRHADFVHIDNRGLLEIGVEVAQQFQ